LIDINGGLSALVKIIPASKCRIIFFNCAEEDAGIVDYIQLRQ
jgi:hypothetical protein